MNIDKHHDDKKTLENSEFVDFSEDRVQNILEVLEKRIFIKLNSIEKQVGKLSDDIHHQDFFEVNKLSDKETELETQLRYANDAINQYRYTLDQVYQSTSWKITWPVRLIGAKTRRLKKFLQLFNQLRKKHSLLFLFKKSVKVISQDGFTGFLNQLKQQNALHAVNNGAMHENSFLKEPVFLHRDAEGNFSLNNARSNYVYIEPERDDIVNATMASFQKKPLFSIVVPLYNTTQELLDAVIKSVESQWYTNWELIFVDDCSPDASTKHALSKITNSQIKIFYLEVNQGISGATNEGLKKAFGDFIVFMDHDDEITPDCLYELACCIERDDPDFIYSDEDKISLNGLYADPHFKPDWSPDTMMSTMFTCHVSCVRKSLLSEVGMLRGEYNGCQDWDFVLRVSEKTKKISHIPKILYHWRVIEGSIAADIAAKSYVLEASQKAREDALKRRGLSGRVEAVENYPGYFRIAYFPINNPLVSIIIPTRDNFTVIKQCIDSIYEKTSYENYEIVIVDNGSVDEKTLSYFESLKNFKNLKLIRHDIPFNFSELNNVGVQNSSGEILLFLNDDTEIIQDDWLERMAGFAQLEHVGAVGAKLLYGDGKTVQHSGVLNLQAGPGHAFLKTNADAPGYFMRNILEYNYFAVTGACLMIERKKFLKISGFEESLPVAYNDIDICARLLREGYFNLVCQAVRVIHHESISRGVDHIDPEKQKRLKRDLNKFYQLNPEYFQRDPFHNINLHPNDVNFSAAY